MNNGEILSSQLRQLGFRNKFCESVVSPQITTYYFNLDNVCDIVRLRHSRTLEILNAYNHLRLELVEGGNYHFGISQVNNCKGFLRFENLNHSPNNSWNFQCAIGKDTNNKDMILDFSKVKHLLISGTTGSGKSVLLNTILCSLLYTTHKDNFDIVIIDNKRVEFQNYKRFSNVKIITEINESIAYLNDLCNEMEYRYQVMEQQNKKDYVGLFKPIFVVVDELADLMLTSRYECEESIVRLSAKARACGIHLILATQRPTCNVVSGLIKANVDTRIALKSASYRDSIVILDHKGAESLIGNGDALIKFPFTTQETRFQVAYTSDNIISQL